MLFIPSLKGGGAERMFVSLSNALSQENEVYLVTLDPLGAYFDNICKEVNVVIINKNRAIFSIKKLSMLVLRHKPDILLTGLMHANIVGIIVKLILFCLGHKTRLIISERNFVRPPIFGKLPLKSVVVVVVSKLLYKYADSIVCVSDVVRQSVISVLNVPESLVTTIYNPVVDERLKLHISLLDRDKSRPEKVIVAAGRLVPNKNHYLLIKAFYILSKDYDARLVILGEGELRQELEDLVVSLGISNLVQFFGFVKDPFSVFANSDLFVSTSIIEGLPGAMIQAMLCDLPIISTSCKGVAEEVLCNGKYGIIIPDNSSPDLLSSVMIKSLTSAHQFQEKKRATEFDTNNALRSYTNLFNSLI